MIKSIAKKLKNIIWYSSYYDFEGNCIVRNRRIDLIDYDGIKEIIIYIAYFIACSIVSILLYYILPYLTLILIYSTGYYH